MTTDHARYVILACCILHNYLRKQTVEAYEPSNLADTIQPNGEVVDGRWRDDCSNALVGLRRTCNRNPTQSALGVREKLVDYFGSVGRLPWQDNHVRRTN